MSSLGLSGLASGMDTDAIVTQLMTLERAPRDRMVLEDTRAQARGAGLNQLASMLNAVKDAATALKGTTTWANVQKVTSSDAARVGVTAAAGAAPGTRLIEVSQLAVTSQHAYTYTPSASPETMTIGGFSLAVDPNTGAADLAAALNARVDSPVSAVVAAGKLVLTSRASGAANDFTLAGTPLAAEDARYARAGQDALYSVDGVAAPPSASNVITSAVLGAELTLKATTTGPISVTVTDPAPDTDAVKAKVNAFVTAYNGAVDLIRSKLSETKVAVPATSAEAGRGQLASDPLLTGVLSSMRSQIGDLSAFGISTGAAIAGATTFSPESVAGKLTVDDTKLTAAMTTNGAALRTALDGLGQRLVDVVTPVAGTQVTAALEGVSSDRKRVADSIARTDVRLADHEKRLRAQFSAMESALAASQAAQSQLSAQLSGLR
jgi:flagellar hook-associated protein 2